jgi:isoleucyl-tRNA synthetase
MEMGIDVYNEQCRSIVMRYQQEWEVIVSRMGRWIDFENSYKTMDAAFMESVWWLFKQLWDRDLVYRGLKVMPYSIGCKTPLSNFEACENYKDLSDPMISVAFKAVGKLTNLWRGRLRHGHYRRTLLWL